jgi:hypothetical protein
LATFDNLRLAAISMASIKISHLARWLAGVKSNSEPMTAARRKTSCTWTGSLFTRAWIVAWIVSGMWISSFGVAPAVLAEKLPVLDRGTLPQYEHIAFGTRKMLLRTGRASCSMWPAGFGLLRSALSRMRLPAARLKSSSIIQAAGLVQILMGGKQEQLASGRGSGLVAQEKNELLSAQCTSSARSSAVRRSMRRTKR